MPVYTYSALDVRGKETKGVINADSARAARVKLRQSGLLTKDLLETATAETPEHNRRLALLQTVRRVRPQDVTVMTRQFATLLSANLTVVDALTALIEQGLRLAMSRPAAQREAKRVSLPVCRRGGGTLPGVDLDDSAALLDRMEGRG